MLYLVYDSRPLRAMQSARQMPHRKVRHFCWVAGRPRARSRDGLATNRKRPAAASAPADCSRTVREVRRRPAPEQISSSEESTPKTGNTTQKTTQKKSSTTPKPIGETAQKILDLLIEDPYLTRQALAPILDLTPDGVKYHLNKLQRDGYLERKEGRKTGRWKVLIKK